VPDSAISIPDRVVVFDYGEVISLSPTDADKRIVEELAGVEPAMLWPRYWATRDELDRGSLSVSEYWTAIGEDLGADWSGARIHEIWLADFRSWLSVEPDVFELLSRLKAGGTRTALLSNAGQDFGGAFRFSPLGALFDHFFVSGELLLLKPEPSIYEHVVRTLGVASRDIVFIDNREINVRGAESIGITGHVFIGAAELRSFLEGLAVEAAA
jgi:putative hydrolase of the HAD superfamily